MININYLRSGFINTITKNNNLNSTKIDRVLEYLRLSQGFKDAQDYAFYKKNLKNLK